MLADLPRTAEDWSIVVVVFGWCALVVMGLFIADLRQDGHPWRGIAWRALAQMAAGIGRLGERIGEAITPPARQRKQPTRTQMQARIAELERELEIGQ